MRLACTLLAISATISANAEEPVSFNRDIRPILSDRCFACHGPDEKTREADLRLDTFAGATDDLGGYAAIVPGKPKTSLLLERIATKDPDEAMPPADAKKPSLTTAEVALFRRWIEQGAKYQGHWSFLPLAVESHPETKKTDWIRNPIDEFILARLQQEGIVPSPEADRQTLIRRVYLDLVGLLPSVEAINMFVANDDPRAYEKLVDQLLDSPHYGERWGRHWLDQARYADSDGFANDKERRMWPYRDWVIQSLNDDMPFDQFTIEQLAGDLLPKPTQAQLVATAFHRNTLINSEGGSDREQFRVESVIDRVDTTGAVWLGLSVACARCHTHKFDPITQREYFELYAFFNSTQDANNRGPTVKVKYGEMLKQKAAPRSDTASLMIMRELTKPRTTYLLTRGDFTRPDKSMGPLSAGVLDVVAPEMPAGKNRRTRLDLARWIVDPQNPLTSRVTVNRLWMRYFGRGLVETENDFGTQGSLPTHPMLLDWLAQEFVRNGWSLKKIHRLVVTSATYRQSSRLRPEVAEKDPRNLLLARQERLRLEGEIARDAALCASGLLDRTLGGPSVYPPQPSGVYSFTQVAKNWKTAKGRDRYRRGLYTFFYRSAPYPLLTTFDAPDFQSVCTHRGRSNTPLQSLTLANDKAFVEIAQGLALRLARDIPGDAQLKLDARIKRAFLLCLSRKPSPKEQRLLGEYVVRQLKNFTRDSKAAEKLAPANLAEEVSKPVAASLVCLARVVLNTDNFIMRE